MFKTKYNPPSKVISPSGDVSLTDSQYLRDCDINVVMKRALAGDTSLMRTTTPVFADVSDYTDFSVMMDKVVTARREFEALPSDVRARFGNDPKLLLEFLSNSENDAEAISLGLKVKPKVEKPVEVVISNPESIIEATAKKSGQEG